MRVRRACPFCAYPKRRKNYGVCYLAFLPEKSDECVAGRKRRRSPPGAAAWALGDAAYWAARAAAQAARALGDERTADYTDGVADDLVALAESAGHVIRR